jgi:SAM-dependent methyltransferase
MNLMHRRLCSSAGWAEKVARLLSEDLEGLDLGDDVLEIGPGYGATTAVLVDRVPRLTAAEVDEASASRLAAAYAGRATIVHGDGTALPFDDGRFSAVVCFTMLHHVPSPALQDALFAEAHRVLRPGGLFHGVDTQPSLRFRVLHIGDTMVVVDPGTLPARLTAVGFDEDPEVRVAEGRLRFTAHKR